MQKKTKGLVAGAAGVALMLSGTTLALWSDSADVDGATLSSGNLAISASNFEWQDVSGDVDGNPTAIDLDEFKTVPGDEIKGTTTVTIDLEGDNLEAELGLKSGASLSGDLLQCLKGGSVTVTDSDDNTVLGGDVSDILAGLPLRGLTPSDSGTYTIATTVEFDYDTPNRDCTNAAAKLSGLGATLTQTR